jgi:hypothetical protein
MILHGSHGTYLPEVVQMNGASPAIPGYALGSPTVPRAPITVQELDLLKKTLLFTDEDIAWLQKSRDVLADQVEQILDVWYGFVGSNPHLLESFTDPTTRQPIGEYLQAVRKRFGQWILDTASARYDQAWLDYQFEIGRRHHRSAKNRTDGVRATEHIPFRYMITLVYPITATLKPFLAKKGHSAEEVEKMHQAWIKSVLLQVTLWCHPYVREGDF